MTPTPTLTDAQIQSYRQRGFVHLPGVITPEEAAEFRAAALALAEQLQSRHTDGIFTQLVNVWTQSETLKRLTLHPNVARAAEALAGVPLRLWHDQILIKAPHNGKATEFHQDQPYWPHAQSPNPISAWIALQDVPVERGCMTFLPGTHQRTDLQAQNLGDARSLFAHAPDLVWNERVTVPLKAGDCTFHHGRCAHMATPNHTDEARVAHIVIFMDAAAIYSGASHVVADPLQLSPGQTFPDEMFPPVEQPILPGD